MFYFFNTITIVKTAKDAKTLADRLIYARGLRGMSQKQLAAAIGRGQSAVGNIESGYRKTMRDVVLAARVLGVSSDWLQDGHGPTPDDAPPGGDGAAVNGPDSAWPGPQAVVVQAQEPHHGLPTITPEVDPYTQECIRIMATLTSTQKQAALARLREFVSYLGPPRNGQALQVAG